MSDDAKYTKYINDMLSKLSQGENISDINELLEIPDDKPTKDLEDELTELKTFIFYLLIMMQRMAIYNMKMSIGNKQIDTQLISEMTSMMTGIEEMLNNNFQDWLKISKEMGEENDKG